MEIGCDFSALKETMPPENAQSNIDQDIHDVDQLGNNFSTILMRTSTQLPQAAPIDEFTHPVYMTQEDIDHLIQCGIIFFAEERYIYNDMNAT